MQGSQPVASELVIVPTRQSEHDDDPTVVEYVPALHDEHDAAPDAEIPSIFSFLGTQLEEPEHDIYHVELMPDASVALLTVNA